MINNEELVQIKLLTISFKTAAFIYDVDSGVERMKKNQLIVSVYLSFRLRLERSVCALMDSIYLCSL